MRARRHHRSLVVLGPIGLERVRDRGRVLLAGGAHVLYCEDGVQVIRDARVGPDRADNWSELDRIVEQNLEQVEDWGDTYVPYWLR